MQESHDHHEPPKKPKPKKPKLSSKQKPQQRQRQLKKAEQHILCVEDNKEVAMMLKIMLRQIGIIFHSVQNGEEALEFMNTADKQISLIILDLRMPGFNGIQFLEERAKSQKLENIPVFILSSDGDIENIAKKFNVTHFLSKGCRPDELIQQIERALTETRKVY